MYVQPGGTELRYWLCCWIRVLKPAEMEMISLTGARTL